MQVDIVAQPTLRTASLRHIGPYNRIPEAFARLGAIAGAAGLIGPGTTMLAAYHDDPATTQEAELRSDAAVTVPAGTPIPNGLEELVIPGGRYARTIHIGSYDTLGDSWTRLRSDLLRSGHRLRDSASYEVYRNTPMTAKPEELVTELYVPLDGAGR